MFREETYPLIPDTRSLADTFTQKPTRIPLELPLQPPIIIREETNWLPILALVLGFFGFLAFLAYMRR